jgi:hypothetical protein
VPMLQVSRDQALTKSEFHERLRDWFQGTGEPAVGPAEVDGRTSWIHVRDGSNLFILHADTSRDAVAWYLGLVGVHGDDLAWTPAPSERGKPTAVVHGPDHLRNTSLYLYVAKLEKPAAKSRKKKPTRADAAQVMFDHFQANRAALPPWVRECREVILDLLVAGIPVDRAFATVISEQSDRGGRRQASKS